MIPGRTRGVMYPNREAFEEDMRKRAFYRKANVIAEDLDKLLEKKELGGFTDEDLKEMAFLAAQLELL